MHDQCQTDDVSVFWRESGVRMDWWLAGLDFSSEDECLMENVKDTQRALVRISYEGSVHKTFRGPKAEERFANEVRVLRHLEARGCTFVPRLLEVEPEELKIVTTNCGARVDHIDEERTGEIFAELKPFGVRHDDAEARNITYRSSDGRFCVIDFEFATILEEVGDGN